MNQNIVFDSKDKEIISLLNANPKLSQEKIAEEIHLSQPSVAVRIRKLIEKGFINHFIGMNPSKLGLYIAKIEITTRNPSKILEMFSECPFFINGFTVSGKNNLCLLFIAENISSLESIVDMHLRTDIDVLNIDFNIIISSNKDFITPIKLNIKKGKKTPCGIEEKCGKCICYKRKNCLGCPTLNSYRGIFW